ncbi:MAG: HTH domain-containing protein [Candidatus Magasanikbacteria bacterium]
MTDIDNHLKEILQGLSKKQKKVLNERMGLTGRLRTLQAIGEDLGVTRERIRQIESSSLDKVKPKLEERFESFFEDVINHLKNFGGVRKDNHFIKDVSHIGKLKKDTDHLDHKIRFVFLVSSPLSFYEEDEDFHDFWYVHEDHKEELFELVEEMIQFFEEQERQKVIEEKPYLEKFGEIHLYHHVPISKKFGVNSFGDFGLRDWPEIEPKVVRDKAYLVLKKKKKPLHFRKIAKLIKEMGIDEEEAHVQTVHNEMIKDNRFVLVGRGMYGLAEQGYEGGTAKEVIKKLLKEEGPLSADEVIKRVNEKKILKDNTIILNLQDKNHFERLEDGRYDIKE